MTTTDSLTPLNGLHIYAVGIMSSERYVAAPNAKAATLFFGIHGTAGNCQLAAVAYERDGRFLEFDEDRMPWAAWAFGGGDKSELEFQLKATKNDLDACTWWPSPKSIAAARIACGPMSRDEWYKTAMAIEQEFEW